MKLTDMTDGVAKAIDAIERKLTADAEAADVSAAADREIKYLAVPFELKALSEKGEFEGYGSTFGNTDLGGDAVQKGAFTKTLADHAKADSVPGCYWMHDPGEPIGEWKEVHEDARGLKMRGQLWLDQDIERARQAYAMLKSRGPKGLSIGYITRKASYPSEDATPKKGAPRRVLEEVDLLEVSVVAFPMNPKALTTGVKSLITGEHLASIREAEDFLRDAGVSKSQARAFIAWAKALKLRDAADGEDHQTTAADALTAEALKSLTADLRGFATAIRR